MFTNQLVDAVVGAVITAAVTILTTVLLALKDHVIFLIKARTTVAQQEVLRGIALQAHAYAETLATPDKMNEALNFAVKLLLSKNITVPPQQIRAAIQDAWMQYNKAQIVQPAPQPVVQTVIAPEPYYTGAQPPNVQSTEVTQPSGTQPPVQGVPTTL